MVIHRKSELIFIRFMGLALWKKAYGEQGIPMLLRWNRWGELGNA